MCGLYVIFEFCDIFFKFRAQAEIKDKDTKSKKGGREHKWNSAGLKPYNSHEVVFWYLDVGADLKDAYVISKVRQC